jgi:NRPS condensation-like uncharacterized protein
MFFHNELSPDSAIYHDVFSFRIESAFDREKLADSLSHLIQRHPILRTSFHLAGFSEPLQLVHRQARFRLTVDDLRELAAVEQEKALVEWIEREKRMPFDRSAAPLLRFHAQWYHEKVFQFIVSFHHACLAGWSLAAILTEIFQDYAALQPRFVRAPSAAGPADWKLSLPGIIRHHRRPSDSRGAKSWPRSLAGHRAIQRPE